MVGCSYTSSYPLLLISASLQTDYSGKIMKISTNSGYALLIRLLPFSLFSYPTIQIFNISLVALILIDFGLFCLYDLSRQSLFLRSKLIPFLISSVILVIFLLLHALTLPVYTLVTTIGVFIRALVIVLFALLGRGQSIILNTEAYKFGLVSACFLSIFNDRLNLFPIAINSNALSITIVSFCFLTAISSTKNNFKKINFDLKYIIFAVVGLGICASRATLTGLVLLFFIFLLTFLLRTVFYQSINKAKLLRILGSLFTLVLFVSTFYVWYIFGGDYSNNRINSLLTFEAQQGSGDTKRLMFIQNASNSILQAPIFGNGTGFTKVISFTNDPSDVNRSIHNTYLTIAVDYGVVGLMIILTWLILYLNSSGSIYLDYRFFFLIYMFVVSTFTDIIASPIFLMSLLFLSPCTRNDQ